MKVSWLQLCNTIYHQQPIGLTKHLRWLIYRSLFQLTYCSRWIVLHKCHVIPLVTIPQLLCQTFRITFRIQTRGGRSHIFKLRLRSCSKIFESESGSKFFSNLRIRLLSRLRLPSIRRAAREGTMGAMPRPNSESSTNNFQDNQAFDV